MRSRSFRLDLVKTPFTDPKLQVGCQSKDHVIIRLERAFNSAVTADLVEAFHR